MKKVGHTYYGLLYQCVIHGYYTRLSVGKYGEQDAHLYNMVMTDTKTSGDIFERETNENVPVLNDIGTYNNYSYA